MPIIATKHKRAAGAGLEILRTADDLVGYAHLTAMRAQFSGALIPDGHAPTDEELEVRRQARSTATRIDSALRTCTPKDIPTLTECYDMMYRLGNRKAPPRGYIERQHDRVFAAWRSGDKEIEESSVIGMLGRRVRHSIGSASEEEVKAYTEVYGDWIETLKRHGCFPKATSYENYQRLAIVMRDDLRPYLGEREDEWKRRWHDVNKVEDLDALGSRILRSYRRFAGSLFPAVMGYEENLALDHCILTILSTRRDLNPYDRQAHRIALQVNENMMQMA